MVTRQRPPPPSENPRQRGAVPRLRGNARFDGEGLVFLPALLPAMSAFLTTNDFSVKHGPSSLSVQKQKIRRHLSMAAAEFHIPVKGLDSLPSDSLIVEK